MAITYSGVPILKTQSSLSSIDATLISALTGANVRLGIQADATKWFVGTVVKLTSSILNATTGIYINMTLKGVDETGKETTLTLDTTALDSNTYGIYDQFFWTNNLNSGTPTVNNETDDSIITNSASIQVWDTDVVKVGEMIVYKTVEGVEVKGIISAVPSTSGNLTVYSSVNGRVANVTLTLVDATKTGFEGNIVSATYA